MMKIIFLYLYFCLGYLSIATNFIPYLHYILKQ
jgi:hypothetical protein